MDNKEWLKQFLFTHTRNTQPDGRPLYAYKCTETKYDELKALVSSVIKSFNRSHRYPDKFAPIFCLYAAEAFCREHIQGVWAWDTIFKPLDVQEPDYSYIQDWVEQGLHWWGRSIITQNHRRLFLNTVACEGGLPLKLLQKDTARINQFFRSVLEDYHRQNYGGIETAEKLGKLNAFRLPAGLQQDIVFHLTGELISKVVELQILIDDTQNPISALDRKLPDWRRQLPLRLEEETAAALFKGLIKRSKELVLDKNARLRWQGTLKNNEGHWQLEKQLYIPDNVGEEQLCRWIGENKVLPSRLRIILKLPTGSEIIAWLTSFHGASGNKRYRREWLRKNGVKLVNDEVMREHDIILHDGQTEYRLTVENGEPWGESPWLFTEKDTKDEFDFLGEGSRQTRLEKGWVLAPSSQKYETKDNGNCRVIGNSSLNRILYELSGTVDFLSSENERYRISCHADKDSTETYSIVGKVLLEALNSYPVYVGLPQININNTEKSRGHYRTQWRSLHCQEKNWNSATNDDCVGPVWIRLVDTINGIEVFRRKIYVLPRSFKLERIINEGGTPGKYCCYGLGNAKVTTENGETITEIEHADGIEVSCPSIKNTSLPQLLVKLYWPTHGQLTITLPYPQRGAMLQLAGKTLQYDDYVSVDRIGGLRLLLQDPIGSESYWIEAELIMANHSSQQFSRLRFRDRLPTLISGLIDTNLLVWQERIASLLNSGRNLDDIVRLEITSTKGECLTRLQITRFDCLLNANYPAGHIHLPAENLSKLGEDWQQRVKLEMFPLWSPSAQPIQLEVNPELIACWNVPADLMPGPWWIIGRDGDWARFRPILWSLQGNNYTDIRAQPTSSLAEAIREPDHDRRETLLGKLLGELGTKPEHPDWFLLFDLIRLTREFPTSSLDVLVRLVSYPQTLALALLKADDESFNCVWSLAEQLPFSWALLPIQCWKEAAALYFQSLQNALGEMDANGELLFSIFQQFRNRASSRRPYWAVLCDWLQQQIFLERPLNNTLIRVMRRCPSFIDQQIDEVEKELQGRHDAEEQWPQSKEVMEKVNQGLVDQFFLFPHLSAVYRPVRCAPFLVAKLSVKGLHSPKNLEPNMKGSEWVDLNEKQSYVITDRLIYELRLIRAFDPQWFDTVYALALTFELSRLPQQVSQEMA
jgi:hypothetical protein